MQIAINIILKLKVLIKLKTKIFIIIIEKKIEPKAPDTVFFGLIFVSFGPLNILPTTNPPISEVIQPNKSINRIIFSCGMLEKIKNKMQNIDIKIIKNKF